MALEVNVRADAVRARAELVTARDALQQAAWFLSGPRHGELRDERAEYLKVADHLTSEIEFLDQMTCGDGRRVSGSPTG